MGSPLRGGGAKYKRSRKNYDLRQIACYFSETVQEKGIVSLKGVICKHDPSNSDIADNLA